MSNDLIIKKTQAVAENIVTFKITDQKTMSEAAELLSQINKQSDAITAEKEKVTKPLNAALAAERKRWKPIEDAITKAKNHLRAEMTAYQTALTKAADEAKSKIAARVGTGKGKLSIETAGRKINEVAVPEERVDVASGSISFKTDYEVTVTDIHKIPEQYLEVKIAEIKRAHKEGIVVPGVEINEIKVPINRRA